MLLAVLRHAWMFLAVLALALVLAPAALRAQDAADPKARALDLCNQAFAASAQDPHRAVALYTKAIELDAELVEAFAGRGACRCGLGEHAAAHVDYTRAIELDPRNPRWRKDRATVSEWMGEYRDAERDLSVYLEAVPGDGEALLARGRVRHRGKLGPALGDLDHAVRMLPESGEARALRGVVRVQLELPGGLEDLQRAVALGDESAFALSWCGYALYLESRNTAARSMLLRARAADDKVAWVHQLLANIEFEAGSFDEALRHIEVAIALDDSKPTYHWVHALVLHSLGRRDEACAARDRAARLDATYRHMDPADFTEPELEEVLAFFSGLLVWIGLWAGVMSLVGLAFRGQTKQAMTQFREQDTPLRYDGRGSALFTLYLKNIVLTVLTLGIYRFWAKVDMLRFRYQHTSFTSGRFDYHGTGLEKFVGFLKGVLILVVVLGGLYWLLSLVVVDLDEEARQPFFVWGTLLVVFLLRPLILVGAQRFNLARTSFSNLRFRFTGKVGQAYGIYLRDLLLLVVTFGLYMPAHQCNVRRFRMQHTQMGEHRFDFKGSGGELFGISFVGVILSYVTLGLYLPWYMASLQRFYIDNTTFRGVRFRSNLKGQHILSMGAPALLAMVVTLGLAIPWALHRWYQLTTDTTAYAKPLELDDLRSIQDQGASATLEGVGEAGDALAELGDLFGV